MTYIRHTVSLHNLPVSTYIFWNVTLIIWWSDSEKSLLGPRDRRKYMSDPGHWWKIVNLHNIAELAYYVKFLGCQIKTVRCMFQDIPNVFVAVFKLLAEFTLAGLETAFLSWKMQYHNHLLILNWIEFKHKIRIKTLRF